MRILEICMQQWIIKRIFQLKTRVQFLIGRSAADQKSTLGLQKSLRDFCIAFFFNTPSSHISINVRYSCLVCWYICDVWQHSFLFSAGRQVRRASGLPDLPRCESSVKRLGGAPPKIPGGNWGRVGPKWSGKSLGFREECGRNYGQVYYPKGVCIEFV